MASFSCAQDLARPDLGSRSELTGVVQTASVSCRTAPSLKALKTKWLQLKEPFSYQKGPTLLFIWTFACWNCYRSIPWLRQMMPKLEKKGIQLVGIHSPEFDYEKSPKAIQKKAGSFQFRWPIYIDNDFKAWRHLNNRYWPAFYVVDQSGCVRELFIGETHSGSAQAKAVEAALLKYL